MYVEAESVIFNLVSMPEHGELVYYRRLYKVGVTVSPAMIDFPFDGREACGLAIASYGPCTGCSKVGTMNGVVRPRETRKLSTSRESLPSRHRFSRAFQIK